MMTPLQEWFFMNVEESVPSAEDCRERFDQEFDERIKCFEVKVRQFLKEYVKGDKEVALGATLFDMLVAEIQAGLQAATLECQYLQEDLHFPALSRQTKILLSILENLNV
jgi:hypothetical protein